LDIELYDKHKGFVPYTYAFKNARQDSFSWIRESGEPSNSDPAQETIFPARIPESTAETAVHSLNTQKCGITCKTPWKS
jgi:hypothetical protein